MRRVMKKINAYSYEKRKEKQQSRKYDQWWYDYNIDGVLEISQSCQVYLESRREC